MAKKYISNKDETPRLFGNDLMEKLSRVHPGVPLIIYGPAIAFFVYRGAVNETLSSFNMIGLFLLGTLFWTFMEYVIHRFAFHYMPKSELGKRFHFLIHGIHHDYPRDSKRLVMPPSVSIPLAVIFYFLYMVTMGQTYGEPFFAGFVFGYLCYDMIHYMLHHFSMRGNRLGLWLQQHHNLHHYGNDDKGFGVSSPLWDFVFGSMDPKIQEKKRQPVQSD
jgi:sterol desaturase/sphingolipid hydroxylase (fatty acid hydroxylase superfamily)